MKKTLSRQVLEQRYNKAAPFKYGIDLNQIRLTRDVWSFIIEHPELTFNNSMTVLHFKEG